MTNFREISGPKRWLITGGCGFIGLNLIKNLIAEGGHFVRVVDNLSAGTREDLAQVCRFSEVDPGNFGNRTSALDAQVTRPGPSSGDVELIVADILDDECALKAADGMDLIVHLAANTEVSGSVDDPRSDCLNNVIGTLNYLEAARQHNVQRFIFASSVAPIGECEPPVHEEVVPHPVSPYGASKLAGEAYCSAFFRTFGLETVALRFSNVYGPLSKRKSSVVAKFIRRTIEGRPLEIYGDGTQTRDFIYIDDLIQAIRLSAGKSNSGGEIYQIATSAETTIGDLVEKLIPILADFGIENVKVLYTAPRLGDIKRSYSDTTKAREKLGWQAEIELVDGLRRTVNWFIK
ncbi:NAD-dependent epimerase/dehydratase family protein [Thermodesulfobacteriota bacterium]